MVRHEGCGLMYLYRKTGSSVPKATLWALISGGIAALLVSLKIMSGYEDADTDSGMGFAAICIFAFFLGFMVVVRGATAWSRYWEAADLVKQARAEWLGVASSLIALCSRKPKVTEKVEHFQHLFACLMSLLYASAMSSLADGTSFKSLEFEGLDSDTVDFIRCQQNKDLQVEVVLQWIQRLVIDQMGRGVLPMSPSILSRVLEQLGAGLVRITAAEKIKELQFPTLYAALFNSMLVFGSVLVPAGSAYLMETWWGAFSSSFMIVFFLWCLHYLVVEIEQPYGNLPFSLPLQDEVEKVNAALSMLLTGRAQKIPDLPLWRSSSQKAREASTVQELDVVSMRHPEHELPDETDDYGLLFASSLGGAAEAAAAMCFGVVEAAAAEGAAVDESDDYGMLFLPSTGVDLTEVQPYAGGGNGHATNGLSHARVASRSPRQHLRGRRSEPAPSLRWSSEPCEGKADDRSSRSSGRNRRHTCREDRTASRQSNRPPIPPLPTAWPQKLKPGSSPLSGLSQDASEQESQKWS